MGFVGNCSVTSEAHRWRLPTLIQPRILFVFSMEPNAGKHLLFSKLWSFNAERGHLLSCLWRLLFIIITSKVPLRYLFSLLEYHLLTGWIVAFMDSLNNKRAWWVYLTQGSALVHTLVHTHTNGKGGGQRGKNEQTESVLKTSLRLQEWNLSSDLVQRPKESVYCCLMNFSFLFHSMSNTSLKPSNNEFKIRFI